MPRIDDLLISHVLTLRWASKYRHYSKTRNMATVASISLAGRIAMRSGTAEKGKNLLLPQLIEREDL